MDKLYRLQLEISKEQICVGYGRCTDICENDCIKVLVEYFGVLGVVIPQYHYERCVGCGACTRGRVINIE